MVTRVFFPPPSQNEQGQRGGENGRVQTQAAIVLHETLDCLILEQYFKKEKKIIIIKQNQTSLSDTYRKHEVFGETLAE